METDLEISSRYARNKAMYDERLIKEADLVSRQAVVDSTTKTYRAETLSIFGTDIKNISFGEVKEPEGYNVQARRLFVTSVIPSLGSEERKMMQMERIKAQVNQDKQRLVSAPKNYEQGKLLSEEEKESNTLLKLIQKNIELDHDLAEIQAKRAQYKKG